MNTTRNFQERILEWILQEGYPTEFHVGNICQRHNLRVFQGYHVGRVASDNLREIDVLAVRDARSQGYLVRVCHVIECKLSKDKPWVILTSPHGQIASAACVAQTIGSSLGSAILWTLAGDPALHNFDFFSTPDRPGFSGRQAFSKGNDVFYAAMQSVTDASTLLMNQYDDDARLPGSLPESAVPAFPVIVVDGQIFEAFFDDKSNQMRIEASKRVRCHWRGARSWRLHATIDIVALEYLDEFLEKRKQQIEPLLSKLDQKRNEIAKCLNDRSLHSLKIFDGPRGFLGLPPLLLEVAQA
jgi:hypothetical protein